jgi:tRNA nucleotidyltransferase/poly(A) polymerase
MFYNLNTSCVEDLTGRGLEDLRRGIIRTPLPAAETFMDGGCWTADCSW